METADGSLPGTGQGWKIVTDPSREFGEFWVVTPWDRYQVSTVEGMRVFTGGRGSQTVFLDCS